LGEANSRQDRQLQSANHLVDHSMYLQGMSGKQEVNLDPTTTSHPLVDHSMYLQGTSGKQDSNNHNTKSVHPLCLQGMGEKQDEGKKDYDDKNEENGNTKWRSGGSGWHGGQADHEKNETEDKEHTLLAQGGMQEKDDSLEHFRTKIEENMRKYDEQRKEPTDGYRFKKKITQNKAYQDRQEKFEKQWEADQKERLGMKVEEEIEMHRTYNRLARFDEQVTESKYAKSHQTPQQINDAREQVKQKDIVLHNNATQITNTSIKINKNKKDKRS
jgi:hypothetical protein